MRGALFGEILILTPLTSGDRDLSRCDMEPEPSDVQSLYTQFFCSVRYILSYNLLPNDWISFS